MHGDSKADLFMELQAPSNTVVICLVCNRVILAISCCLFLYPKFPDCDWSKTLFFAWPKLSLCFTLLCLVLFT